MSPHTPHPVGPHTTNCCSPQSCPTPHPHTPHPHTNPQAPTWSGTVSFFASRQGQARRVDIWKRGILVTVEQVGGVG